MAYNFKGWYSKFKEFIPKEITIEVLNIHVVGYFPYETASLPHSLPALPSILFAPMLRKIGNDCNINDNKFVIVVKSRDYGHSKIAFYVKDGWVRVGTWDQVQGYTCKELLTK